MNFSRSLPDAKENRCVESKMIGVLPLVRTPEEDAGKYGHAANGMLK
jgi:hypothetical protein